MALFELPGCKLLTVDSLLYENGLGLVSSVKAAPQEVVVG